MVGAVPGPLMVLQLTTALLIAPLALVERSGPGSLFRTMVLLLTRCSDVTAVPLCAMLK